MTKLTVTFRNFVKAVSYCFSGKYRMKLAGHVAPMGEGGGCIGS